MADQPSKKIFPLLSLPIELRYIIYKDLRVVPFFQCTVEKDMLFALQRTCHQIRAETRPFLFSEATFHLKLEDLLSEKEIIEWVDGAGDELLSRVKKFEISTPLVGAFFGDRVMLVKQHLIAVDCPGKPHGPTISSTQTHPMTMVMRANFPLWAFVAFEDKETEVFVSAILAKLERRELSDRFSVKDVKALLRAISSRTDFSLTGFSKEQLRRAYKKGARDRIVTDFELRCVQK
ncbi:hypothetical protein MMC12_000652 [Toensbergia leucococca]|nr:hypothetical protein [Toensbergia leucococca]